MELDAYLLGLYRLLAHVGAAASEHDIHVRDARLHQLRTVQQRLAENLPAFLNAEVSAAQAAVRAEVVDALVRTSLRVTGRAFESFCQVAPGPTGPAGSRSPALAGTRDAYEIWLEGLVAASPRSEPEVRTQIGQRTLQLLPHLNPTERGPVLQRLYDMGLIFNLGPRLSLDGAYMTRSDLTEASLVRAYLVGVNFRGARLVGAALREATLCRATLITAQVGCGLLGGADLEDAEMAGVGMMNADLRGANLRGANLVKATLRRADLTGACLQGTNLLGSHLEGAVLISADMRDSNLLWANLTGADLTDVRLENTVYSVHTRWPAGFEPRDHAMVRIE